MKRIASIFLMLFVLTAVHAQSSLDFGRETFQFAKKIEISESAGKNFRYEMAVHSDNADSLGGIRFFGVATDVNEKSISDKFVNIEKRAEQEWTVFTIVGHLPKGTTSVSFYTSVTTAGTYYFDDISLFVETYPGTWKQLGVVNSSFEDRSPVMFAGYAVIQQKSGNPRTTLSEKIYKTGRHSLMISYSNEKEISNLRTGE
jgi:hypothetical protein